MSAVEVHLTLASRSLITRILGQTRSVTMSTARVGREIRKRLDLRESEKLINAMEKIHEQAYMAELIEYKEKVDAKTILDTDVPPEQTNVSWDELMATDAKRFTIDDAYITWLLDEIVEKDWRKVYVHNPNGTVQMSEASVSVSQMEAIAELGDVLEKAKESPVSESGKQAKDVKVA